MLIGLVVDELSLQREILSPTRPTVAHIVAESFFSRRYDDSEVESGLSMVSFENSIAPIQAHIRLKHDIYR
jgi:hypothetical protein